MSKKKGSMFRCLNPGAVGISVPYPEAVKLASATGFEGIDVYVGPDFTPKQVKEMVEGNGLRIGGCGLPVDFRTPDETKFQESLANGREVVKAAVEAGCTRFPTWILPFSDSLDFKENFRFHTRRLGACARMIEEFGGRIGLEFIGPKTMLKGRKYEFCRTIEEMIWLCRAVGQNAGLLLDSWHWYTAHHTVADIEQLDNRDVVYVHINDAPAGVPVDEQIDNVRRLPGETGVIDLVGFLKALKKIGYDGPVVPEPFVPKLSQLKPEEAARLVMAGLDKVWKQAGV